MKNNPKFSIVTVARNSSGTIGKTVQSVRQQDYPLIEHIVIDGASTDQTLAIVNREIISSSTVVSEPDTGIYNAMNKGLNLANGDVIAFLNSDDYYASPTVISEVAAIMVRDPTINAVFGNVAFFKNEQSDKIFRRYESGWFKPSMLQYGLMPAHPATFISKPIFDQVGGFREDFKIAADFELIARIFANEHIKYAHVPKTLTLMSAGGASTKDWRAKLKINSESIRACRMNGIRTNTFRMMLKYPIKLLGYL